MSNVKRRFRHPTGIEYFDNAMELDIEVWSYIKKEFKNKSRKEVEADCEEMKDAPEGCIPYRYWDTHGKPLHGYCWELARLVRMMYDIGRPRSKDEAVRKRKIAKAAVTVCWHIHDALRLTEAELPTVDLDKLDGAFELLDKEINLLEGVYKKTKPGEPKESTDSPAPQEQ